MNERNWSNSELSLAAAKQSSIEKGDIVRGYDFPGSRNDCYVEGVVLALPEGRVKIHVTNEVWKGKQVQVDRFQVVSPLGVSSLSQAPCVFLIAKREVRS